MASVYIPPHLRKKPASVAEPEAPSTSIAKPLATPSWKPRGRFDDDLYTVHEIHAHFWGEGAVFQDAHKTTLHSSAGNPNGLSWVLLFDDANPKWNEEGIIYVKSNLDLLPTAPPPSETKPIIAVAVPAQRLNEPGEDGGVMLPVNSEATDENRDQGPLSGTQEPSSTEPLCSESKEGAPIDHSPFAVFSQQGRYISRSFKFIGWYKIDRLQILEPLSQDLVDMLMEKWVTKNKYGRRGPRKRDPSSWMESLSCKWAVVQMKKDEEATMSKGEPTIERREDDQYMTGKSGGQSVNEMLAKMRLEGEGKEVAPEEEET